MSLGKQSWGGRREEERKRREGQTVRQLQREGRKEGGRNGEERGGWEGALWPVGKSRSMVVRKYTIVE